MHVLHQHLEDRVAILNERLKGKNKSFSIYAKDGEYALHENEGDISKEVLPLTHGKTLNAQLHALFIGLELSANAI